MNALVFGLRLRRGWLRRAVCGQVFALLALLMVAATVQANSICFCVDCPAGSGIGLPVGVGHGFVTMMPMNNAQAGQTLGYGLYPAGANIFGGAGEIRNDTTRRKDFCITYPVTVAQYNAAAAVINAAIAAPPAYNITSNNCVDFVNSVAAAAGITLPNTATGVPFDGSVSDPAAMWNSFNALGVGGVFMGGTVATIGGPVAPNTPNDYSYAGLVNDMHLNAANTAAYTSLALNQQNLGAFNASLAGGVTVNLFNSNVASSITSIDWGDGSPDPGQFTSFSHVYGAAGPYTVQLRAMDAGAVHAYDMLVNVSPSGSSSIIDVTFPTFPPATGDNPGFGPGVPVLAEIPEPAGLWLLAATLPAWAMMRKQAKLAVS